MSAIVGLFSQFGVTWAQLAGQLVTFIALLVLLKIFLYKPVLSMLEERKQRIAQGLQDAEAAAEAKKQADKQSLEAIQAANSRAEEILGQTQLAAESLKQELTEATQAELAKIRQAHEQELARMKQEMLREVRQDMAKLVVTTSQKVLQKHLTTEDQQRLTQAATKELQ